MNNNNNNYSSDSNSEYHILTNDDNNSNNKNYGTTPIKRAYDDSGITLDHHTSSGYHSSPLYRSRSTSLDDGDFAKHFHHQRLMVGRLYPVKVIGFLPDIPPLLAKTPLPFKKLSASKKELTKHPEPGDSPLPSTPLLEYLFKKDNKKKKDWKSFLRAGSMRGSIFNLCSATLGAGALSLPYAFAQSGLVLAIILLLIGAYATVFSIELLLTCRRVTSKTSYEDITVYLFGKRMGYVVELNIIVFCFGIMVAYIVAIGDILTPLLNVGILPNWMDRKYLMIGFWALIMFPLSLLDKMNSLRFSSFFGVMAIFYLVFSTMYHSIHTAVDHDTPSIKLFEFGWGVFKTMPVVMFAFTCQVNVFQIQSELERPTMRRMMKVTKRAIILCLVVYTLMGTAGYIDFGAATDSDILTNYHIGKHPNGIILAAFIAITLTVVMAFPLNVFPCRYTIAFMLWGKHDMVESFSPEKQIQEEQNLLAPNSKHPRSDNLSKLQKEQQFSHSSRALKSTNGIHDIQLENPTKQEMSEVDPEHMKLSRVNHVLLTFVICGLALLVALYVPKINIVFQLMGGTSSAFVCFVLPAAFVIKLECWHTQKEKVAVYCLFIGGIVAGVFSTIVTLLDIFHVV